MECREDAGNEMINEGLGLKVATVFMRLLATL